MQPLGDADSFGFEHGDSSLRNPTGDLSSLTSYQDVTLFSPVHAELPHRSHSCRDTSIAGYSRKGHDDRENAKRDWVSRLNSHRRGRRNSMSIMLYARKYGVLPENRPKPLLAGPTKSAFPPGLPIAQEKQTELDLENFRLARACGMTLDTISVSKPRDKQIDEGENKKTSPNSDAPCNESKQTNTSSQPCEEPCSSAVDPRDDLDCPTVRPAPPSPTVHAKNPDGSLPEKRPEPPFPPILDPKKQLMFIDLLLKLHRDVFDEDASPIPSESLAIEKFTDVERLLDEHEFDSQLQEICRQFDDAEGSMDVIGRMNDGRGDKPFPELSVDSCYRVFGQPLAHTRIYASCVYAMGGYRIHLPIVVHACVEELYRTGMTAPGLFRTAPDRARHAELIEIFDNGPSFGRSVSLGKERTADVCALLRSYIDRLPRPIWLETLFDPMLKFCVQPSLRAEAFADASGDDDAGGKQNSSQTDSQRRRSTSLFTTTGSLLSSPLVNRALSSSFDDIIPFSNSLSSPTLSTMARADVDVERENPQIAFARALFRLLPQAQLALLAYLCAFFTQVPLCPHNQLAIEDIARFFGVPLFLGKGNLATGVMTSETWAARKEEARQIMVWILKRWAYISEGLFDPDSDEIIPTASYAAEELTSVSSSDESESVRTALTTSTRRGSQVSVCTSSSDGQATHEMSNGKPESSDVVLSGGIHEWQAHVQG